MSQLRCFAAYHVSPPDMSISYCIWITPIGHRWISSERVTDRYLSVQNALPLARINDADELIC